MHTINLLPHYTDTDYLPLSAMSPSLPILLLKGATSEEEAAICLSLLMGYNATIYNDGDKESKIQSILDRSFAVLDHLPASLLKCQLLTYCYGEVFEEDLAQEAHQIMDSWKNRALSEEEKGFGQAKNFGVQLTEMIGIDGRTIHTQIKQHTGRDRKSVV